MNKESIKRNKILLYSAVISFMLATTIIGFFIWVLVDRSDYAGWMASIFYILIGTLAAELALFGYFAHKHGVEHKEDQTVKYSVLAFFTSFIFIGQWIYIFTYRESGVKDRKISDTLYLYYASKIESLIDSGKYIKKLNDRDKDQVEILLDFKKTGIIKKYEANFYISRIMTRAGVLKDVPLVREEVQIIASNLI